MEIHALVPDLDPASQSAGVDAGAAKRCLLPLVYETLVGIDDQGRPVPQLAISWRADANQVRWEFVVRPGVRFHDGTELTPSVAASALAAVFTDRRVSVTNSSVVLQADQPMPDLLWELSEPVNAVILRDADGKVSGTGPFQIAEWKAPKALLSANPFYWGGRPFLDGIGLQMGRSSREQLLDFDLDKADLVELPPQEARRSANGPTIVWSSAPLELLALVFNRVIPSQEDMRKALALSIDRSAIHAVLVQRHGEIADSLLPGWLSGYGFLFSRQPEQSPAPRPAGSPAQAGLVLSYDPVDPLAKATADRIAVDARKAGIVIRPAPAAGADAGLRLVRARIAISTTSRALIELAAALGVSDRVIAALPTSVDGAYQLERSLLEDYGIIPLLHLPEMYAAGARVRSWNRPAVERTGVIHFEDLWLTAGKQ